MKATTLVKSFTVVLIFVAGVGTSATEQMSKEACMAKVKKDKLDSVTADCLRRDKPQTTQNNCVATDLKMFAEEECADYTSNKDIKADCDSKFSEYLSDLKATNKACAKAKAGSSCRAAASACGVAPSAAVDGDSFMSILNSLISTSDSGSGGGCNLYDPTLNERKAEFDEKIARLEDEKVDAVTKQAELDDELNQKKNEVNEKISDLEAEFRKDETEAKNQSMREAADLQKKILASNKKIRDNLARIADKNVEITNLSFGIQQIMIESSDFAVNKACRDKAMAAKAVVMAPVVGADGKKKAPKFSMKESQKIKADLKHIEDQCKEIEKVKKGAQLKGIADKRRLLMVEIDTFQNSNKDEQKSIELDRKALEDKEKLLTENQRKALEEKNRKLDNLSKSVTDMAAIVERKKKALDAKIKKRDETIQDLIRQKNEVKPIFEDVESAISDSDATAEAFLSKCCPDGHHGCVQVERTSGGSSSSGSSGTGTRN